jgi:hypothetical protein
MSKPKTKWRHAIGTTSRVPLDHPAYRKTLRNREITQLHYLIADFDGPLAFHLLYYALSWPLISRSTSVVMQRTPNGWHLFTNIVLTFDEMKKKLTEIKADKNWIKIGAKRGYWFLADKGPVILPYPVKRMQVHWHKKDKC